MTSFRMPVLFVGHGNPMNGLEDNEFARGWRSMVEDLPRPHAVLCDSAHWETWGTGVSAFDRNVDVQELRRYRREPPVEG